MPDEPEEAVEVQIHVPPENRAGVWANFATVARSPYEFTLDFVRLEHLGPGGQPSGGVLVSRVSMSPLFIMQLIDALKTNYDNWAATALPPEVTDGGPDHG